MSLAAQLRLPGHAHPAVLATGAWMGNAVAALRAGEARLSASVGDLADPAACRAHEAAAAELLTWLGPPRLIAHDLHPDFHSSRHALLLAQAQGSATLAVQHHHAHIAATCLEHDWHGPLLGIALDGVGLGSDGGAWGGELLRVDGAQCARLGHLRPLPLPGGDIAAREPWRMALAALHLLGRDDAARRLFADEAATGTLLDLLARNVRCPASSSAGRLFDAAAGLLNLCRRQQGDAEAARALETAATRHIAAHGWPEARPEDWQIGISGGLLVVDLLPLLAHLAEVDSADAMAVAAAAARFHAGLIAALAAAVARSAADCGLRTVAFGGGCFHNRLLRAQLPAALAAQGLQTLMPERLPPGDAGLALGQAWVGACALAAATEG